MIETFPYHLIDLTHTLDPNVPTWNGGCGFNHEIHIDYDDCEGVDKFRILKYSMIAGIGTHMDAPSHCFPGHQSIHDLDVNDLCFPCFVIDVSAQSHELYAVTKEDILSFEEKHGTITNGSCVMIKTGWARFWGDPKKYHHNHVFPDVSVEAAELLIERGVQALGVDTLSSDRPDEGFPVHRAFLGSGRLLIENVANLEKMPPTGAFVMALPLKVKDGTEAPIRLVGLVEKILK